MVNNQQSQTGLPEFKTSDLEAKAQVLIQILSGRKPAIKISPQNQRAIESLASAYRQGQKQRAFSLSNGFYEALISPETLAIAYAQVVALKLSGNSDFQIVMDSLRDKVDAIPAAPQVQSLPQEEAIVFLLLAITHSDKNSISYKRVDTETGKLRPTTFPLTEQLIQNFLSPFDNHEQLFKRYILVKNNVVMSNPAAYVFLKYQQRKKAHQIQLKALQTKKTIEQSQQAEPKRRQAPANTVSEVNFVCTEFEKMFSENKKPEEQKALQASLQAEQIFTLMPKESRESTDFGQKLAKIYRQHLSPGQASFLSAKLASRMKRVLTEMDSWKEEYWSDFQSLMQKQGLWEGGEWLDKWRSHKKGKVHLKKELVETPEIDELGEMIKKSEKIKDKIKGKKLLEQRPTIAWVSSVSQASREEKKVLQSLAKSENIEELFTLEFSNTAWEDEPANIQMLFYEAFCMLSETSLDTIKEQILKHARDTEKEDVRRIFANLELLINQIMLLYKQDPKLSFFDALDILEERHMAMRLREKTNAPEYRNSAAAKYSNYGQGA